MEDINSKPVADSTGSQMSETDGGASEICQGNSEIPPKSGAGNSSLVIKGRSRKNVRESWNCGLKRGGEEYITLGVWIDFEFRRAK